jgi:hypothetical protein
MNLKKVKVSFLMSIFICQIWKKRKTECVTIVPHIGRRFAPQSLAYGSLPSGVDGEFLYKFIFLSESLILSTNLFEISASTEGGCTPYSIHAVTPCFIQNSLFDRKVSKLEKKYNLIFILSISLSEFLREPN